MAKRSTGSHKRKWWLALLVIIGAAFYIGETYVRKQLEMEKVRQARYAAFGIDIPDSYQIHGIDVSDHQRMIDWNSVAAMRIDSISLGFAFIKATEGVNLTAKQFKRNWKQAKEARMIRGAYHFFLPTKSGVAQARSFIKIVDLEKNDLPPVVDVEQLYNVPPLVMKRELKACLEKLEQHYKVRPIIYTYVHFYNKYLGSEFDGYPLWIAHYLSPEKPRIGRSWSFWQHSETGNVNGIRTKVDFNVFYGDSLAFKKMLFK